MKRIQLFEFEDFQWLPSAIRTGGTNLIIIFHKMIGSAAIVKDLLEKVRSQYSYDQITDMGSGSGGPIIDAVELLNQGSDQPVDLVLSDLHPNENLVKSINSQQIPHVTYHPESVNAADMATSPKGLRTMMASFHHMPPPLAKRILQSAQDSGEPFLIYEVGINNVPKLLWWLLLPLSLSLLIIMVLFMTPLVRPMKFSQLFFTYVIPFIPIVYAWDGQASIMRTYTFDDIKSMLPEDDGSYRWEIEPAMKANGKKAGFYVMGIPNVKQD